MSMARSFRWLIACRLPDIPRLPVEIVKDGPSASYSNLDRQNSEIFTMRQIAAGNRGKEKNYSPQMKTDGQRGE
jgi:hypothetical protein